MTFGDGSNGGLTTEPPNESGRMQQTMRHNEAQIGQVYRRQEVMDNYGMRLIEFQGRQIEKLLRENIDSAEIIRDVILKQAQNAHELEMKKLQYERESGERAALLKMGPPLINTIANREVFPQGTEDSSIVSGFIDQIVAHPEMLNMLSGFVPPAMLGPLTSRIEREIKKRDAVAEAQKNLTVWRGNPSDDVVGGPSNGGE